MDLSKNSAIVDEMCLLKSHHFWARIALIKDQMSQIGARAADLVHDELWDGQFLLGLPTFATTNRNLEPSTQRCVELSLHFESCLRGLQTQDRRAIDDTSPSTSPCAIENIEC
jgi:hypothetical protein